MKSKLKTHKGLRKRIKITSTGKVTRNKRRARNSKTPRRDHKATNTDKKQLILAHVTAKKVKKMLNI